MGVDNSKWPSDLDRSKVALGVRLHHEVGVDNFKRTSDLDRSKVALGVRLHWTFV